MKIYGIVYLIRNKINNKIYIGQTIHSFDERYKNNLEKYTTNQHLKDSIKKYGIKNFEIDKIFDKAYSKEELDKLEELYIKVYNATNRKCGYNIKTGGSNGKLSLEAKIKLSNSLKGKKVGKNNPMHGKFGEKHHSYGSKRSAETRQKMSNARIGRFKGRDNPCYGKPMNEEQKRKISKSKIGQNAGEKHHMYGKTMSEEQKSKISKTKKGKMKGKDNPNHKELMCITTNKTFYCRREAGEYYNIKSHINISKCCNGKRNYCGKLPDGTKLQWKYI